MFKNLLKEIEKIGRDGQVAIPLEPDEKGYLDRECPNQECLFQFKIFESDWEQKIGSDVHCPKCGNTAKSDNWHTKEQIELSKEKAVAYLEGRIGKAMKKDAEEYNRSQPKNSFINMSISVKAPTNTFILPVPALEKLEQEITCRECEIKYSILGSAFFCPNCGHNSANETFNNTIANIESYAENLNSIRDAVSKISKDQAENTCRSLMEKGILDCVTAFQRFCEVTYSKHPKSKSKIPFNAFQKLDVGSELWNGIIEKKYSDWLTKQEFERLQILFQRRHLLQHTDGIVDDKYLDRTSDETYNLGQRIVVKKEDMLELLGYVMKLHKEINELVKL